MAQKRTFFSECRKKKGTQKNVALDLDISEIYLRKIERGCFVPGRDLMFKCSEYFKQPLEALFPDYFSGISSKSDN